MVSEEQTWREPSSNASPFTVETLGLGEEGAPSSARGPAPGGGHSQRLRPLAIKVTTVC